MWITKHDFCVILYFKDLLVINFNNNQVCSFERVAYTETGRFINIQGVHYEY